MSTLRRTKPSRSTELLRVGTKAARAIAQSEGRSLSGYRWRLWRLGISAQREAIRAGGMTSADVAAALGVHLSSVYRWAARGWLRPTYGYALTAKQYSYDAESVSAFLTERGALLPLQPVPVWRDEVDAARRALLARSIRGDALMACMLRPQQQLAWLRRRHGFPEPALRLGSHGDWYDRALVRAWLASHPRYRTASLLREVEA